MIPFLAKAVKHNLEILVNQMKDLQAQHLAAAAMVDDVDAMVALHQDKAAGAVNAVASFGVSK